MTLTNQPNLSGLNQSLSPDIAQLIESMLKTKWDSRYELELAMNKILYLEVSNRK